MLTRRGNLGTLSPLALEHWLLSNNFAERDLRGRLTATQHGHQIAGCLGFLDR